MARKPAPNSIDAAVLAAVEAVVARASRAIAKAVARLAAERLDAELAAGIAAATKRGARRAGRGGRKGRAGSARPRTEITKWAADRRARRVPTFVIEMTGLETKKAIQAKYGEGVVFEKGKPAPKAK